MRIPVLEWAPKYERSWLRFDVIAGLTVVALLVPEGMAYAQIAGVPPQAAFYAAPIGLLMFAIFGSSKQLVVAVSSAIASMSFGTISTIAEPNTATFITLTAALAILAGVFSLLAGLLKLGRVAQFFSESVMVGFISGLALLIMVKQLPKLLGIEAEDGNFWERLWGVLRHLGHTHGLTLLVGASAVVLMLLIEHFLERIPAALVALVLGIAVSAAFGLEHHGVEIVGDLPSGLAAPQWPDITAHQWLLLVPGAIGIALVGFAEAIGPVRAFAKEHGQEVDADQEFVGLGFANIGAGLFRGFSIGSSLSKSAANDRAGARSQVSGVIAAALTAVVALFFTGLFRPLPEAVLGAIVVVAVSSMVKWAELKRLFAVRRVDFVLAVIALLAVLTVETLQALVFSVAVSAFVVVWRTSRARLTVLGRVPDRVEFTSVRVHTDNVQVPGLLMVRPDNELFFANVVGFRDAIVAEVRAAPQPVETLLVDLAATTELDVPAVEMLDELAELMHERGTRLVLASVIEPAATALQRIGAGRPIAQVDVSRSLLRAVIEHMNRRGDEPGLAELQSVADEAARRFDTDARG